MYLRKGSRRFAACGRGGNPGVFSSKHFQGAVLHLIWKRLSDPLGTFVLKSVVILEALEQALQSNSSVRLVECRDCKLTRGPTRCFLAFRWYAGVDKTNFRSFCTSLRAPMPL